MREFLFSMSINHVKQIPFEIAPLGVEIFNEVDYDGIERQKISYEYDEFPTFDKIMKTVMNWNSE